MVIAFAAPLWLWQGKGAWHFLTLPQDAAAQIKFYTPQKRVGWGSVRVSAHIGQTKWQTSLFPDKNTNSFHLPMKADVRQKENINIGNMVKVELTLETGSDF